MTVPAEARPLDRVAVAAHLVSRGLAATVLSVERLSGGVSGSVYRAETDAGPMIVKQPLSRLAVEADWRASTQRVVSEASALRVAEQFLGSRVPAVCDLDEQACILVTSVARTGGMTWKAQLMDGVSEARTAAAAATLLADLHRETLGLRHPVLQSREHFVSLRIDPYFRRAGERIPALADAMHGAVALALGDPRCLVHGDYSPKNLLVDPAVPGAVTAVDWEVAHLGMPEFDVAFLLSHLLLKSIAGRVDAASLARTALDTYRQAQGSSIDVEAVAQLLGALLVARVVGWSPVEYLSQTDGDRALDLGRRLLLRELSVDQVLEGSWLR